jgi:5-methylcytosine-specific restriction protein A
MRSGRLVGVCREVERCERPTGEAWNKLRKAVLARDKFRCANCGRWQGELHVHHVVPIAVGGTNVTTNLVTLCRDCHARVHPWLA